MIILAPLGGGPCTPELVAATSNAGAFATLACAYLTPDEIRAAVAKTRALTPKPFAINLFVPAPSITLSDVAVARAIVATRPFRRELKLPDPSAFAPPFHADFDAQFAAVLEARPDAFTFVFGLADRTVIAACRKHGIKTWGTATSLDEARALETLGVDIVIAQGYEAGGHRGIFSAEDEDPHVATDDLTRALVATLRVPVIATGGIMDGRDIARVMRLGAKGAALGTAFLLCPESGTSAPYREALRKKRQTALTRAFSGRLARGLENRFMREVGEQHSSVLPFPAQNAFTRDIRTAAALAGDPEMLSLWAGEGIGRIREMPAALLVAELQRELAQAL